MFCCFVVADCHSGLSGCGSSSGAGGNICLPGVADAEASLLARALKSYHGHFAEIVLNILRAVLPGQYKEGWVCLCKVSGCRGQLGPHQHVVPRASYSTNVHSFVSSSLDPSFVPDTAKGSRIVHCIEFRRPYGAGAGGAKKPYWKLGGVGCGCSILCPCSGGVRDGAAVRRRAEGVSSCPLHVAYRKHQNHVSDAKKPGVVPVNFAVWANSRAGATVYAHMAADFFERARRLEASDLGVSGEAAVNVVGDRADGSDAQAPVEDDVPELVSTASTCSAEQACRDLGSCLEHILSMAPLLLHCRGFLHVIRDIVRLELLMDPDALEAKV
jgi:hypothetical protein